MKIVIFAAMIALSAYAYTLMAAPQDKGNERVWEHVNVMNADGTRSKYELMLSGKTIVIHANHTMGDGSIRYTIIEDSNGDNIVDVGYVVGYTDERKMHYNRRFRIGLEYRGEWQEEYDESRFRIEKLLGRSITKGAR